MKIRKIRNTTVEGWLSRYFVIDVPFPRNRFSQKEEKKREEEERRREKKKREEERRAARWSNNDKRARE